MAENSENQALSLEQETENGEQSVGFNSYLDLGLSSSGRISNSPVGSTEGLVKSRHSTVVVDGVDNILSVVVDGVENKYLEENFSVIAQHGSVGKEFTDSPVDFEDEKDQLDEDSQFQDAAGREEMFVDAPDQLSVMSDGRSVDNGEATLYLEPQEGLEENFDHQVVEDAKQVRQLTYELALLQASLEKTAADKEIMAQKHKEEREMFGRELGNLQRQLETMANQQLFLGDNGNVLIDRLNQEEKEYKERDTHASDNSWQFMIADCSKYIPVLKSALKEQLQSERTIRDFNALIFTNDQDIENLSAQVTELSVSHDVIVSYMESQMQTLSQFLRESSKGRVERDLHLDVVTKKLIASLASVVEQEELSDDCSFERISLLEKSTSLMIENYNRFLFEIDLLKQCLTEVVTEVKIPEDTEFGIVFDMVRRELLDHKRMECDFIEKLNQVENVNAKLLEQLDKAEERINVTHAEVRKIKMEIEQEKIRSATTKEKLGMAVTKGKALVQQRDSLKQSLAEKTNELEKCLLELQEKSNALESAEMCNEELIKSKSLSASLQESLSKRAMVLEEIEELLSRSDIPDGLQSVDIIECVRWLADQKNELLRVSLEYNNLKSLLVSLNLPEVIASSNLESKISWLWESLSVAEDNIIMLQGDVVSSKVAVASLESELAEAFNEIDHLKSSISIEKGEKDSLQMGLKDLSSKYEGVVEREFQVTSAKDRMARMFLEACGVDDQGEFHEPYSDMAAFIDKCVGKIKEQITTTLSVSLYAQTEQFERMQSLLYVRDQEVVLCKDILEEETMKRSEMTTITYELKRVSEEIIALKDEKDSLQRNLERSDEKSALVREKLSMAVKKGKGLVQEREGLKKSLDEKNTKIQKLKLELQQQESLVIGCRDQIKGLTSELERLPKLEYDLLTTKDQKEQLEKYLLQSNSMLERVVEYIESVVLPPDTVFEEPADKVKWLADCFNEYQIGKVNADQELEKLKEEGISLSEKLTEAHATTRSLEEVVSEAEKSNFLLVEEKKAVQVDKTYLEQELEKAKREASSQASKFVEASANINSLEDALSRAEKNIAELEADKAVDRRTIKSLEEGLSHLEKSLSVLTEEKNAALSGMASLERELEKAKGEAGFQASKLADVYVTVKSLEDALSAAEDNMTVLTTGKENAELEVQALNAKLSASMSELAGTHGSLESQSVELLSHLNRLQVLMNDNNLLSSLTQDFERKFEGLRDLNFLLENIRDQFVERGSEQLHTNASTEKDPYATKVFSAYIDKFLNGKIDCIETIATDHDDILSLFAKIVEGLNKKNKLLEDKFKGFSSSMDELIAILLRALQAIKDDVIGMLEPMESLKVDVTNLGAYKQAAEHTIFTLKNDIAMLLSAWSDTAEVLGFHVDNSLVDLIPNLEVEKLNNGLHLGPREASEDAMEQHRERLGGNGNVEAAENLASKVRSQIKMLENVKNLTLTAIKELQNELKEARLASENAIKERDVNQKRISTLESDLEALQDFCSEMKIKLKDCEAKEDMLKEKDAELSLLRHSLATKEKETEGYFLSDGQVKTLFEKIDHIEILSEESDLDKSEFHYSGPVKKLFDIIDNVAQLQHQMRLLSSDKEELQSNLAVQVDETERLKKEAESLFSINKDLGKTKSDLTELIMDLERLIQKFGGNDSIEDKKFGVKGLFALLENLVMASIRECETSKSEAQESGAKLHENQKVVDELSEKVKLLEDSIHSRPPLPDPVQERSIFKEPPLATGSEISEIEDVAPLGRNSMSPVPPAAHVRTLRKGSSDHLAITIDSESDRLINLHETDDDKGHVFKSLTTSGLIPKQGKLMADRIDGIWVSGGRVLMSRPRARIGLIAYCLLLHLWLLGTIL